MKKIGTLGLGLLLGLQSIGLLRAEDALNKKDVVGKTVAIVDNKPIFSEELERLVRPIEKNYQRLSEQEGVKLTEEKIDEIRKEVLNRMIEDKLLLEAAKKSGIRATKVEIERGIARLKQPFFVSEDGSRRANADAEKDFETQMEKEGISKDELSQRVEEQVIKEKLISEEVRGKVQMATDDQAKKYFDRILKKVDGKPLEYKSLEEEKTIARMADYFKKLSGEQVRVRHILIRLAPGATSAEKTKAKDQIDDLLKRLKSGEDFSFLATQYSEDPISAKDGGDLGFFPIDELGFPEIEAAVKRLNPGEISGVVESSVGFHVIKLIEKKAPHRLEYGEVAGDLKDFLTQKEFTEKLEEYISSLKKKSSIQIKL